METKIISLGNEFIEQDSLAFKILGSLKKELPNNLDIIHLKDSFGLMSILYESDKVIIVDVVEGLKEVSELSVDDLKVDGIISAHDFDASFVLKLLFNEKDIRICGIPQNGNFEEIKSKVKEMIITNVLS